MNDEFDVHNALDLLWSDGYEDENVRALTIQNRGPALRAAIDLLQAEQTVNFSLFSTLDDAHPSPQIYALDFPSDARAAFYVMLGGYYKQAILCLRSWLEMRLLGIVFGRVDGSKYADWKNGNVTEKDKLYGVKLIDRAFGCDGLHKADTRNGLRSHLDQIYGELSVFTHGQGVDKHRLQADTDNVPRYNERSVDLFLELFRRTANSIIYCLWLAYGEKAFKHLDPEHRHTILDATRPEYRAEMEAVLSRGKSP